MASQDIIGLMIPNVMSTAIWNNVVILADGLELLGSTLPEEVHVQVDGLRAHKMAPVSAEHQVTMLGVIL